MMSLKKITTERTFIQKLTQNHQKLLCGKYREGTILIVFMGKTVKSCILYKDALSW